MWRLNYNLNMNTVALGLIKGFETLLLGHELLLKKLIFFLINSHFTVFSNQQSPWHPHLLEIWKIKQQILVKL